MRNLEKVFEASGSKFFVLRRISIDIQAGEFVTFMGPSGAGKSTLLSIIGMLDSAWSAEYHFLDQPVHRLDDGGTTIIQVPHAERNATYGHRIMQLKDGWVVSEEKAAARVG